MPTYEYQCEAKHITEKFYQRISKREKEIECKECGKPAKQVISLQDAKPREGYQFGFYVTDKKTGATTKIKGSLKSKGGVR